MIRDIQLSEIEPAKAGSVAGAGDAPVCAGGMLSLRELKARWGAALAALVPMGYEDEAGFHYGSESQHSAN